MPTAAPLFHVFTLVTRTDQYEAMLASLDRCGFTPANTRVTLLDNRAGNRHEPFSAITAAVRAAEAPWVIFCHQDLLFERPADELAAALRDLDARDPAWGVAGNAGGTPCLQLVYCLDDHSGRLDAGTRPARVLALDENFLVIRRDAGLRCSPDLAGFHLYATDLCLNAYAAGASAWVIEYRLTHAGSSLDYRALYRFAAAFEAAWSRRIGGAVVKAPAIVLLLTRSRVLRWLLVRTTAVRRLYARTALLRRIDRLLARHRPAWLPSC